MAEWQWLSPEQYLVLLMTRLGVVPDESAAHRISVIEAVDADSVRRLTRALLLAEDQLTEHWQQDGDRTPAEALDRATADWWGRRGQTGPGGLPDGADPASDGSGEDRDADGRPVS
ncbi:hypothetical protein [uncultured Modestobacter sp.]|uniref:hypothetical protein n=1 Tax=uncultured Modestobacter sp. TaxID=380048 RepID=UPI002605411B|nr:hypothetical protein [uncultured Modestobacter sp.]